MSRWSCRKTRCSMRSYRFPALFIGICLACMAAVGLVALKEQGHVLAERCPDGSRGTVLRDWAAIGLADAVVSADPEAAALLVDEIETREPPISVAEAFPTATCEGVVVLASPGSGPDSARLVSIGRFASDESALANLEDTGIAARSDVSMRAIDERTIAFATERSIWLYHAHRCLIVGVRAQELSEDRTRALAEGVAQAAAEAGCTET